MEFNRKLIGKTFRKNAAPLMKYIAIGMSEEHKQFISSKFEENEGKCDFTLDGYTYNLTSKMLQFKKSTRTEYEEKYLPGVIEPSFGVGRTLWAILEHCFRERTGKDSKRTYFKFPPRMAPVKCSILPLIANEKFMVAVKKVEKLLKRQGLSCKIDKTDITIGIF